LRLTSSEACCARPKTIEDRLHHTSAAAQHAKFDDASSWRCLPPSR
jgi:hypothetical protein